MHESVARKGRKQPNITQKRNAKNTKSVKGWYLNDCVRYGDDIGWICGFTSLSAYVRTINEQMLKPSGKTYQQILLTQLQLVSHNNGWQYCYK